MNLCYSFIIPVYNRPNEIKELLDSFLEMKTHLEYEIVIVEDGSTESSEEIVKAYPSLSISYYKKANSGPGDSRNYGMKKAKGNYFIILDSDVLLPPSYLSSVDASLHNDYVDCFGGPDTDHESFTSLQKAINYCMTSILTTGGIRGNKKAIQRFEPRSFNLGISKKAFEATGGFGNIHPGEDPDLVQRLWKKNFKTTFIEEAFVHHKRRISWKKFFQQVSKFGSVRPILNKWHPNSRKFTFWFPTLFSVGLIAAILFALFNVSMFLLLCYVVYALFIVLHATLVTQNFVIGLQAALAAFVQFMGYGYHFLKNTIILYFSKKQPEELFPKLFFK